MSDTIERAKEEAQKCIELMEARCSKYGESWKNARLSSLVDYSIMKFSRVNKMVDDIEGNRDKIESDLQDMINYGLFSLVKLREWIPSGSTDHIFEHHPEAHDQYNLSEVSEDIERKARELQIKEKHLLQQEDNIKCLKKELRDAKAEVKQIKEPLQYKEEEMIRREEDLVYREQILIKGQKELEQEKAALEAEEI